jgi:hypothetical protein
MDPAGDAIDVLKIVQNVHRRGFEKLKKDK